MLDNTESKLKNHLRNIFDYYRLRYKLDCNLIFKGFNGMDYTCLDSMRYPNGEKESHIYYSFNQLNKSNNLKARLRFKNKLQYYTMVLLHEIKHALDFKSGVLSWENDEIRRLGINKEINHASFSYEKRADYFANQEIIK